MLDARGASELEHKEIAEFVRGELANEIESTGWWAQAVTVAYEQYIGRRQPGQMNDGTYEISVTKVVPGTKQDVFALWTEAYNGTKEFDGHRVDNIRTSSTPLRLYWRCDFSDGSRLAVAVEQKTPEKALIAIAHTKLGGDIDREQWQRYWRHALEKL